jgi:hypothetical protein
VCFTLEGDSDGLMFDADQAVRVTFIFWFKIPASAIEPPRPYQAKAMAGIVQVIDNLVRSDSWFYIHYCEPMTVEFNVRNK